MFMILSILSILWLFFYINQIYFIYIRNSKPYLSDFLGFSLDEVPSFKKPNELSILLDRKINIKTFVATFFYLMETQVITLEKQKEDIIFTYQKSKDDDKKLSLNENYLLSTIFSGIGENGKVTLSQLASFCKFYSNRTNLLMEYTVWKKIAYQDVKEIYFEPKKGYKGVSVTSFLGMLLILINFLFQVHIPYIYALCFPIFFLHFYFKKTYKRTKKANTEYFKWTAYKRYLFSLTPYLKDVSYAHVINLIGLSHIPDRIPKEETYMLTIEKVLTKMIRDAILNGGRSLSLWR